MGDLIERDKIYEAVYDLACKSVGVIGGISEDYAYGLRAAAHMIEEAPAVDAAPVVRCKECIHSEETGLLPEGILYCNANAMPFPEYGYCNRGIGRENRNEQTDDKLS